MVKWFEHAMRKHPILSNCLLSLNLWVAGDLVAQTYEQQQQGDGFVWNVQRTAQCAGFGVLVTGPIVATWYPFLDRILVSRKFSATSSSSPWTVPILKVVADEFVMDPPCLVAFFGYTAAWEHVNEKEETEPLLSANFGQAWWTKTSHEFWPVWTTAVIGWTPLLLVTFRYVPVWGHAPLINTACIVWDAFLSFRNHQYNQRLIHQEQQEDGRTG